MATTRETGSKTGFGTVSRVKGLLFEGIAFGASVVGIVALAALLVYVAVDAFDLTAASPEWLLTYFLTLVVPFVAFCLYSAGDPATTRRVALALGGGLVAAPVGFTAFEALVRPIPRLTWPLAYLFVVIVPSVVYATYAGSTEPVGAAGVGLIGKLLAGTALGLVFFIQFFVVDARLWFLVYTLGFLPAAAAYAVGHVRPNSPVSILAVPVGIAGTWIATVLRDVVAVYPTTTVIYAWTIAVPLALVGAALVARRADGRTGVAVGALLLALSVGGSGAASAVGVAPETAILILAAAGMPTVTHVHRVLADGEGRIGLLLPALLIAGALAGAVVVRAWGLPAPDPWLDASYVTSAPSRHPTEAGLYPAIIGSVLIISLVAILSFLFGVGSAVFLEEYTSDTGIVGAVTRLIGINVANLAAVPSIVYGLLGLGLFANLLGLGFGTLITASLTLSLLILPITIVSAQEAIRAVPDDLRQGSYAMGATRWQTTKNVVLPEALPGILTGTILALGRAIGETAPLIAIGAATTVFSPPNDVESKLSAMPMQIFEWAFRPQPDFRYGVVAAGVVTLLLVLLGMNATAIVLRNRYQ